MNDATGQEPREGVAAEFSVAVDLRELRGAPKRFELAASPEQCGRIAKRLGVRGVQRLEGEVSLSVSKIEITAKGVVRATLARQCVASLEEMTETVDETFEAVFLREAPKAHEAQDDAADLDGEADGGDWDAPEIHESDIFDLGELLTQQLALAMAPFPRKPGATSLAEQYGEDKPVSPFADLARRLHES